MKSALSVRRLFDLGFRFLNGRSHQLSGSSDQLAAASPCPGGPELSEKSVQECDSPLLRFAQDLRAALSIPAAEGDAQIDEYIRKNFESDGLGRESGRAFMFWHWDGSCWTRQPISLFHMVKDADGPQGEAA